MITSDRQKHEAAQGGARSYVAVGVTRMRLPLARCCILASAGAITNAIAGSSLLGNC
jgi:hypothetical protein